MAEGYDGGDYEPIDQNRDKSLDQKEYNQLRNKFEVYPRLRRWGLDWFIPKDDR